MINIKKIYKFGLYVTLLAFLLLANVALAAENPEKEALSVANQYQSMFKAIDAHDQKPADAGLSQRIFSIAVVTKLKNIINQIELQRKNLVDLVMGKTTFTESDTKKLNNITKSLETERYSLFNLLGSESEFASFLSPKPYPVPGETTKDKDKVLRVYGR
jgi:hypothetical protein